MGNCCSYESIPEPERRREQSRGQVAGQPSRGSDAAREENLFDAEAIRALIEELRPRALGAPQALAADPVKTSGTEIANETVEYGRKALKMYGSIEDDPEGYKLQKYHHEVPFPYTPELYLLVQANMTEKVITSIDDNVESFEILHRFVDQNDLILVTKIKTKKVLVIEGRTFLTVKLAHREPNGDVFEAYQHIGTTLLNNKPHFQEMQASQKNLAKIKTGLTCFDKDTDGFTLKMMNHVNLLSGVGLLIIKPMVKKSAKAHYHKLVRYIAEFLMDFNKFEELVWFTADKKDIIRVFIENLERMKNPMWNLSFSHEQINIRIAQLKGLLDNPAGAGGAQSAGSSNPSSAPTPVFSLDRAPPTFKFDENKANAAINLNDKEAPKPAAQTPEPAQQRKPSSGPIQTPEPAQQRKPSAGPAQNPEPAQQRKPSSSSAQNTEVPIPIAIGHPPVLENPANPADQPENRDSRLRSTGSLAGARVKEDQLLSQVGDNYANNLIDKNIGDVRFSDMSANADRKLSDQKDKQDR